MLLKALMIMDYSEKYRPIIDRVSHTAAYVPMVHLLMINCYQQNRLLARPASYPESSSSLLPTMVITRSICTHIVGAMSGTMQYVSDLKCALGFALHVLGSRGISCRAFENMWSSISVLITTLFGGRTWHE